MSDQDRHAVLLCDAATAARRAVEIADLLSLTTGQPAQDLALRVRYGSGIVARELFRDDAEKVAAALELDGMAAFLVAEDGFVLEPRRRKITGGVIGEDAFFAQIGHAAAPTEIPWRAVRIVNAYALAHQLPEKRKKEHVVFTAEGEELDDSVKDLQKLRIYSNEAMRIIESVARYEERFPDRDVKFYIDLSTLDASYQVRRREYNFEGLGDLCMNHSMDNFMVLLRQILKRVRCAFVPERSVTFAETADLAAILVEKEEEQRSYARWVQQLIVYRPDVVRASVERRTGEVPDELVPDRGGDEPGDDGAGGDESPGGEGDLVTISDPSAEGGASPKPGPDEGSGWKEPTPEQNPMGMLLIVLTILGLIGLLGYMGYMTFTTSERTPPSAPGAPGTPR